MTEAIETKSNPSPSPTTNKKEERNTCTLSHDFDATIAPVLDPEAPHELLRVATWNTRSFNRNKAADIHERLSRCYDIALAARSTQPDGSRPTSL